MQDFRKLQVWRKSHALALSVRKNRDLSIRNLSVPAQARRAAVNRSHHRRGTQNAIRLSRGFYMAYGLARARYFSILSPISALEKASGTIEATRRIKRCDGLIASLPSRDLTAAGR